jgi:hypothetical protein
MKRNYASLASFLGGVLPHHLIYLAALGAITAVIQYTIDALCNEVNTRKIINNLYCDLIDKKGIANDDSLNWWYRYVIWIVYSMVFMLATTCVG